MMYSEASITSLILPVPLSAADKAPQCGQSGRVQLGWHNGVFHPTSPLPGPVLSWTRCGVCGRIECGRVNNYCDTLVHLDNGLFFKKKKQQKMFLQYTHLSPACLHMWAHRAPLWHLTMLWSQSCFILFCLTGVTASKWHAFMQIGCCTLWDVGFSFVLLVRKSLSEGFACSHSVNEATLIRPPELTYWHSRSNIKAIPLGGFQFFEHLFFNNTTSNHQITRVNINFLKPGSKERLILLLWETEMDVATTSVCLGFPISCTTELFFNILISQCTFCSLCNAVIESVGVCRWDMAQRHNTGGWASPL